MQIYSGFFELQKRGVLSLKMKPVKQVPKDPPVLIVTVNKKYKVAYDTLDGFTWVVGDRNENLSYFKNTFNVDFYFKRSFHQQLLEHKPNNCHLFPLGLHYSMYPSYNMLNLNPSFKDKVKYFMKTNKLFRKVTNKQFFYARDFEHYPTNHAIDKVLFMTRLWDPMEAKWEGSRSHREMVNQTRVECINLCRKEFGDRFTGGLYDDAFSRKNFSDLIISKEYTSKGRYLQAVKEHSICIATTGLHDSIGWKFGEYVAAARAIVSEPLQYEVPGDFKKEQNYLEFSKPEELIAQIDKLLTNKDQIMQMMKANYCYYNNYLKPDKLILNTLLEVMHHSDLRIA
jgi:hypothetical protein